MSHFTVIVVGDDYEAQLAPYHEFECTGFDDQYVVNIDKTEEARADYLSSTSRMVRMPYGDLVCAYDNRFYREPTPEESAKLGKFAGSGSSCDMSWSSRDWGDGLGYRTKIHDTSIGGGVAEEVKTSEVMSFRDYCVENYSGGVVVAGAGSHDLIERDKYGWIEVDASGAVIRVIDRTNPNAKWDWYKVGGRWSGYFTLKPDASGHIGRRNGVAWTCMSPADVVKIGDVDIDAMRQEAADKAGEAFDLWACTIVNMPLPKSWSWFLENVKDIQLARQRYNDQPAIVAYGKHKDAIWRCPVDAFGFDRDAHMAAAAASAISPLRHRQGRQVVQQGRDGVVGHGQRRDRSSRVGSAGRGAAERPAG